MYGRISDPEVWPYSPLFLLVPRTPDNQQSRNQPGRVGVSTPCGAISTWEIIDFVPSSSK